jgi:excisionase family DNA binding protein
MRTMSVSRNHKRDDGRPDSKYPVGSEETGHEESRMGADDLNGSGHLTPLLVSVRDAAALLGIGRTTVYELIAAGELEAVHIRRAVRVPMAAIEEYVAHLRRRAS